MSEHGSEPPVMRKRGPTGNREIDGQVGSVVSIDQATWRRITSANAVLVDDLDGEVSIRIPFLSPADGKRSGSIAHRRCRLVVRTPERDIPLVGEADRFDAIPREGVQAVLLPAADEGGVQAIADRLRQSSNWMYGKTGAVNAANDLNLKFRSRHFRSTNFIRAMELGLRGDLLATDHPLRVPHNSYRAMGLLREHLTLIDSFEQGPETWPTGCLGAALTSLVIWPETAEFWRRYAFKYGNMKLGEMDPVQAAVHTSQLPTTLAGREATLDLYRRMLNAAGHWHIMERRGEPVWIKRLWGSDPNPNVAEARRILGLNDADV